MGYRGVVDGLELVLNDNSAVLLPGNQRVKQELAGLLRWVLQIHQRKPFTVGGGLLGARLRSWVVGQDPDIDCVYVDGHEELEMDVAVSYLSGTLRAPSPYLPCHAGVAIRTRLRPEVETSHARR